MQFICIKKTAGSHSNDELLDSTCHIHHVRGDNEPAEMLPWPPLFIIQDAATFVASCSTQVILPPKSYTKISVHWRVGVHLFLSRPSQLATQSRVSTNLTEVGPTGNVEFNERKQDKQQDVYSR